MTLPIVSANTLAATGNLSALKEAVTTHNPQALREAAQQFESLFTGMMLKSMRQASFSDPLFGSDQANMYQDMYDEQVAAQISKGRGLGLADMLVRQLQRSGLPGTTQAGSAASTAASSPSASGSATASGASTASGSSSASSSPTASGPSTPTGPARSTTATPGGSAGAPATRGASSAVSATTTSSNTGSCPSTVQQLQFAQSLWPEAQRAARQLGVSPVSLVAQAALETDWGRSLPRAASGSTSNNLFGIKAGAAWSGASVQSATQEYDSGTATAVKAQFRSYATPGQCFQDYVSLLQDNPRYAGALGTGADTHAFAAALQRGGYATDPAYAAKLGAVAGTLTRVLTQAVQAAAGSGYLGAASLKSAASLPTTSGSNTL